MPEAFVLLDDGTTKAMTRVRCVNEDRELQRVLHHNLDLLPGDQIDPDNPRRWLLIKREMPVPDPGTGTDRWSIDFFFADQEAIPTFVECKRFNDTRSRREVVGQMLEYAANGHYYWTAEAMREYAIDAASARGETIDQCLEQLGPSVERSVDEFFAQVQENLREGQIRIVFFMEESPPELRSVVDFLNKQMERAEVLLVEARQYKHDSVTVVVPTLFGYTEEARLVKRTVTVSSRAAKKWNESLFFAELETKVSPGELEAVKKFYRWSIERGAKVRWGRGAILGSVSLIFPDLWSQVLLMVNTVGQLTWNWPYLADRADVRDALQARLVNHAQLHFPEHWRERFVATPISEWHGSVDAMLHAIDEVRTNPC